MKERFRELKTSRRRNEVTNMRLYNLDWERCVCLFFSHFFFCFSFFENFFLFPFLASLFNSSNFEWNQWFALCIMTLVLLKNIVYVCTHS